MTQAKIAEVLSVPANMVNVQMMRAGGSYGSKVRFDPIRFNSESIHECTH